MSHLRNFSPNNLLWVPRNKREADHFHIPHRHASHNHLPTYCYKDYRICTYRSQPLISCDPFLFSHRNNFIHSSSLDRIHKVLILIPNRTIIIKGVILLSQTISHNLLIILSFLILLVFAKFWLLFFVGCMRIWCVIFWGNWFKGCFFFFSFRVFIIIILNPVNFIICSIIQIFISFFKFLMCWWWWRYRNTWWAVITWTIRAAPAIYRKI